MYGFVRDPDGRGIPGIPVSDGRETVLTDGDGRYTLTGSEAGFLVLSRPAGFTADPWWRPAGHESIDFELVPIRQELPYEFVHLTDTHLTVPSDAASERRAASLYAEGGREAEFTDLLASLTDRAPNAQAIFLTGDLVDEGVEAEYVALRDVLASSPLPVYAIPGNHDHMNGRSRWTTSRNDYLVNTGEPTLFEKYMGPRWFSFDVPGLHVVAMDWHTHELGLDHQIQNEWLQGDLACVPEDIPWVLLFHDQPGQSVLAHAPRPPVATFSGHWHTSRVVEVDGTLHVNTPPTLFAGLDYSPPMLRRVVWDGARFTVESTALHDGPAPDKATIAAGAPSESAEGVRWHIALAAAGHRHGVSVHDGVVYAATQQEDHAGGALQAVDVESGVIRWTVHTPAALKVAPTLLDGLVICPDVTGSVTAFDQGTGDHRWTCPSSDPLRRFAWGAAAAADGRVIVGDQADLRCLDVRTGEVLWRRTDLAPHHNLVNHSSPLVIGSLAVVGFWPTPEHPIAVDIGTGRSGWRSGSPDPASTATTTKRLLTMGRAAFDAESGTLVFPGHSTCFALDAETGELAWVSDHEGGFSPAPAVVTPPGIVVTVAGAGLRMLDRTDGRTMWETPIDHGAALAMRPYSKVGRAVLSEPTVLHDQLHLPGLDGTIRTFDLDGRMVARRAVGTPMAGPLAVSGSTLIGLGVDGGLLALDVEAGR